MRRRAEFQKVIPSTKLARRHSALCTPDTIKTPDLTHPISLYPCLILMNEKKTATGDDGVFVECLIVWRGRAFKLACLF